MTVGTESGAIADNVGASLIGAGMISVLAYPLLATVLATETVPRVAPAENAEF